MPFTTKIHSYLALGDSYTIGEQVPISDSFPYQLVQLLRDRGIPFNAPEIIARTGWTTDELMQGISITRTLPNYQLVTLLIGVNNQYRGRTAENYAFEFAGLLQRALEFTGNRPSNLVVLSIPDWGVTPFAEGRDRNRIAEEINAFNAVNKSLSLHAGAQYLAITEGTREAAHRPELLAPDGLHPSSVEYGRWAALVSGILAF